jgi:hypothetical protein
MPHSRRNHYRVTYPFAERPMFEIGWTSFEVVECSESGLRYELGERHSPTMGSQVSGKVVFRSGETIDVTGDVVRLQNGLVALVLLPPGIPFALVIREQRYLRGKGYQVAD